MEPIYFSEYQPRQKFIGVENGERGNEMPVDIHKPNESPLCWGQYKDNQPCCQNCGSSQGCAEELVCSILEGRSRRPSRIVELK